MIDLHVYLPWQHRVRNNTPGELHLNCWQPTTGHRAKMLYIHGSADKWAEPHAQQWLQEYVMTRLTDDNPARVVWNA